jgi:hypothetical protein
VKNHDLMRDNVCKTLFEYLQYEEGFCVKTGNKPRWRSLFYLGLSACAMLSDAQHNDNLEVLRDVVFG